MSIYTKIACYAALMGVWGIFAFFGRTPVDGFIAAVTGALAALGAIHAVGSKSDKPATPPQQ
ncbi:hypothetical protein PQR71_42315 [Paraburkholderia fungorum]|uniref:hypothetical protein n=1 Tax=Paraburkholderia fungorum TaxID=134537 RepID=UPI0038B94397